MSDPSTWLFILLQQLVHSGATVRPVSRASHHISTSPSVPLVYHKPHLGYKGPCHCLIIVVVPLCLGPSFTPTSGSNTLTTSLFTYIFLCSNYDETENMLGMAKGGLSCKNVQQDPVRMSSSNKTARKRKYSRVSHTV